MNDETSPKFVAHIDILGMSVLVQKNFREAWGMLSDLVDVRDKAQLYEYEFVDKKESIRVFERIHMVTFSDTLLLFTETATDLELKAMLILVSEIFHKALCRCVPVRAGVAMGEFWFNHDRSMYAGPALIDAYQTGESSQWLGISLANSVRDKALAQCLTSSNSPVIVDWEVPTKVGVSKQSVVNWPALFANDLKIAPPISVQLFYSPFEDTFGPYTSLPESSAVKYINTVDFMNKMLEVHNVSQQ